MIAGSPCAQDAGSFSDEIGGKQLISARWNNRTPSNTMEMFRHTHKPYSGQSMVAMQRVGIPPASLTTAVRSWQQTGFRRSSPFAREQSR
mmetsp:Transcript_66820/g.139256  ORF Transcript_66820/g.139256 Transcript_66820/m.139256 type:complete len:90 (+) Transcript_66820:147-416(+)